MIAWTPLQMIYRTGIVRDRLVNAIDTCRIFETSFDFCDEDGDGWDMLQYTPNWHESLSTAEAEAVASFCSWLVKSSSPDIKDNFIEDKVWNAIFRTNDDFADFVDLLLGLSPAGALDDNAGLLQHYSHTLLSHIKRHNWKIVNLLLARGADPHRVYTNGFHSPVAESPLSLAMYSSWTFWDFRNALHGTDLDVKDFAHKELEEGSPLLDTGWQMETLTALFELEFEPDASPHETERDSLHCDSCNWWLYQSVVVQPYWQVILESIKNGIYPQGTCSDIQDGQPKSQRLPAVPSLDSITNTADDSALSQDPALSKNQAAHPDQESRTYGVDISSTIFDRKEGWCVECWLHFKKTGHRRSPATSETESSNEDGTSEDDFTPYLIHT